MATGVYDITHNQGDTFHFHVTWRDANRDPVDLSAHTAKMQIREGFDATTFVAELTTENGGITLGGLNGTVDLFLSATDTALIAPSTYKYDLEITTGGDVRKILKGKFKVLPEVTK